MWKLDAKVVERYPGFCAGYGNISGLTVESTVEGLVERKQQIFSELKMKYGEVEIAQVPEIKLYRKFFVEMGADPSAFRPAPEYLLRRALEDRFPSINNVVDSCLLASARHSVVAGVYDLEKVAGTAVTSLAETSEELQLIDGRKVSTKIGEVILRDDKKILAAFTSGDSKISMVTPKTSNVLVVVWNAPGIERKKVEDALQEIALYLRKYCGGHVEGTAVLP
ncbi:MAG: phenylalanine--tRNA ligase beta subunit-related protein [Candidatus Hadarchaeales archaeon]